MTTTHSHTHKLCAKTALCIGGYPGDGADRAEACAADIEGAKRQVAIDFSGASPACREAFARCTFDSLIFVEFDGNSSRAHHNAIFGYMLRGSYDDLLIIAYEQPWRGIKPIG